MIGPWAVSLLSGMLGMTILTLAVLAALPILSKRYRLRTVYGLLVLCLFGFLIPWRPLIVRRPAVTVEIPAAAVQRLRRPAPQAAVQAIPGDAQIARPAAPSTSARETAANPAPDGRIILLMLWAAGAASVLAVGLLRYFRMKRMLLRWRTPPDPLPASMMRGESSETGLKRVPPLWQAPCVSGPMVCGLFRPAVYLPERVMDTADLRLILRHELVHVRQGDVPVKWLTLLACAVYWPNPVIWLLRRALNQYCELSCDERVMAGADLAARTRYAETIIAAIRVGDRTNAVLCTAFRGGLKRMKRRILQMMDHHTRRVGVLVLAALCCLTALTGCFLRFSAADPVTALPDFPKDYVYEAEELFALPEPCPAVTGTAFAPAYNYSDDPQYPAALYAPGTPLEVTGRKWRSEHIPGVTGTDGMVWLQVDVLAGEPLTGVWMPEAFVDAGGNGAEAFPRGVLRAAEGQAVVPMYDRITDKAPAHTIESGREAELISWQPGYAQVRIGGQYGYVDTDQFILSGEIMAQLAPEWMYGFDSWRLGYGEYYNQYYAWFGEMEYRYGSFDMWSNELKAAATRVQRDYGLLQPGDPVYVLPGEGDITAEEAIAIGKRLIGDDGGTDELGVPFYTWQAHFMYTEGEEPEPGWTLRAWATHTDMDRWNIRLTRRGELVGDPRPYRDVQHPTTPYYSVALMLLYGEMEDIWPAAIRTAFDPEGCPPLREGWKTEEEIRRIAMDALESAFGAEKRASVEARFDIYASYYNYGRFDENDPEERIFWTVRCVNRTPGEAEEIQVRVNMDGTLREEPIDDYYGDIDFSPGGNG